MKKLIRLLIENILIVVFVPIIVPFSIYVRNSDDVPMGVFFRAALISILLFIIMVAFASLVFHDQRKTILFSSVTFLLLYFYGALYDYLLNSTSDLGHHKILAVIFIVVIITLAWIIFKVKLSSSIIQAIKVISSIFIILQIFLLVPKIYRKITENPSVTANSSPGGQQFKRDMRHVAVTKEHGTPDVYYIILDSYGRNDVINKYFSYDNSHFTDSLKDMGFYIANCSRSNYMVTRSSLASSLNLEYLQEANPAFTPGNTDNRPLITMIQGATVFQLFKSLGYETNTFKTNFDFINIVNVDHYRQPSTPISFLGNISPYEILLFKHSIFRVFYDTHIPWVDPVFDEITFPHRDYVDLQNFIFTNLIKISTSTQPNFTYAHLTVPHTPYIFRADGTFTMDRRYFGGIADYPNSNELFIDGYVNQIEYVNQRILSLVKEIISISSTPPIIIIQGDHGAIMDDRLPILNAYYFPGVQDTGLYPSISPVNSFRLLFDDYFAGGYPILEDNSYYSLYNYPYNWKSVAESSDACLKR